MLKNIINMITMKKAVRIEIFLKLVLSFLIQCCYCENIVGKESSLYFIESRGFLDIKAELALTFENQDINAISESATAADTHLDRRQLNICIGSYQSNTEWQLSNCETMVLPTLLTANRNLQRFELLIPLSKKFIGKKIALLERDSDMPVLDDIYWIELPSTANPKKVLYVLQSNATIKVNFSIACSKNFYGAHCEHSCNLPTQHHRCDQVTGKISCSPGWMGENCELNVFISRKEATHFLRKRANVGLEEIAQGNIERECREEVCSREEAREAFEDDALTEKFWRSYTDPNHCEPNPCSSRGTRYCEDLLGNYTCHCLSRFSGRNCEIERQPCEDQPCRNGGTCLNLGTSSFTCLCENGFRGFDCSTNIDECVQSNCGSHGTCIDGINSFTCQCDSGFTGLQCDVNIDDCQSDPCQNGGNCTDHVNFYECQCPLGFEGINCESEIAPCRDNPCQNGGKCNVTLDFTFTCSCLSGFVGELCQEAGENSCTSQPCYNGATCYTSQNYVTEQDFGCVCPVGYTGMACETEINPCEVVSNPCPVNASCVPLNQQFFCICPQGFSGDNCQLSGNFNQTIEMLRCQENPCLNDAQCFLLKNKTTCVCRAGFEGESCENEVDHCSSNPCMDGGECIMVPDGFYCNCPLGLKGTICDQDIDECALEKEVCLNGATCLNAFGSYQCECDVFFTGRNCEAAFDPCLSEPCQNGGSCELENAGGYLCRCLEGYGGNNCQMILDPCTDVTNPCLNEANCTANPELTYEAICSCTERFYGRHCSKRVDNCAVPSNVTAVVNGEVVHQLKERSDCGNNGDCISTDAGFECKCHPGFRGSRCQQVYQVPLVSCDSPSCICPDVLLEEVAYHHHNQSSLECRLPFSYHIGTCENSSCVSLSCSQKYQCRWKSTCLSAHIQNDQFQKQIAKSINCNILEVFVERQQLLTAMNVEEFCQIIRNQFYDKSLFNSSLILCQLLEENETNSSIAISIEAITSEKEATLLALELYETFDDYLKNKSEDDLSRLSPILDSILEVRFPSFSYQVPKENNFFTPETITSKQENSLAFYYYIIIAFAAIIVVGCLLLVWFCYSKTRKKEEYYVSYVAHQSSIPNQSESNDREVETTVNQISTPKKSEKYLFDDGFVNPVFRVNQCSSQDVPTRDVRCNTYVTMPYATFEGSQEGSVDSSFEVGAANAVEKNTIDYSLAKNRTNQHYEIMNNSTSTPGSFLSTAPATEYDFATDTATNLPKNSLKEKNKKEENSHLKSTEVNASTNNQYEEISFKNELDLANSQYEVVECASVPVYSNLNSSPTFNLRKGTDLKDSPYNFAGDIPSIGVPLSFPPSRGNSSPDVSEKEDTEPIYLTPMSPCDKKFDGNNVAEVANEQEKMTAQNDSLSQNHDLSCSQEPSLVSKIDTELTEVYAVPKKIMQDK